VVKPYVSVLTATYNRRDYLPRAFESLQNQTCADFEWVVCDDGSTDGTCDLMESLRKEARFELVYLRQNENSGRHFAMNHCARAARGVLVCGLDSDDQLTPDAIAWMKGTWQSLPCEERETLCGIVGQDAVLHTGARVAPPLPIEGMTSSFLDMPFRHGRAEDNHKIIRRECYREFPFPEEHRGAFFPETIGKWYPMGRKYDARYFDHVTILADRQTTSIQRPGKKGLAPRQWRVAALASRMLLEDYFDFFWLRPIKFVNHSARYACYGALTGESAWRQLRQLRGWVRRAVYLASLPIGACWYARERFARDGR